MTVEQIANYFYENPEVIAGIAAGIGLGFAARALRYQQSTDQIKLAESVFKDLRALEKQLSETNTEIKKIGHIDYYGLEAARLRADWRSQFLNTLEWLAFLINESKVKDKKVIGFFKGAVVKWYDEILVKQGNEDELKDTEQWPELKKLYKTLKKGGRSRWRMKHETF